MRLLALAGDADALIAHIRLRTPLQLLCERQGWPLVMRSFHDCTSADVAAADVMIVQRGLSERAWRLQRAMRLRGGAVVYEIDDLLTDVPAHISNQAAIRAAQPWLRRCMAECDLVTTSTARLAQELGVLAAQVVPNCAWPAVALPMPPYQSGRPVTLLLASMESLASDFIYPALRAVQGPGVEIVVVGPAAAGFTAAGVAVQAQALLPRAAFIDFARALPNPVAVIPLEASRFAACKSAVKWFEYANAGIAVLCSTVPPYADVVQTGVTGVLVPNDAQAWQQALQRACSDADARLRIAAAAQAQVRQHHTLEQMVAAWQQALQRAVQRRAAVVLPAADLSWRWQQGWRAVVEAPVRRLRQINRARLARRRSRR